MALPNRPSHGLQELTRSSSSMRVSSATATTESNYATRMPLRTARSDRSVASSSHQPANTHGEPVAESFRELMRSSSSMRVSSATATTESNYAARTPLRTARSNRSCHQPANTHGEPVVESLRGLTRSSSTMSVSSFTDWPRPALSASRTSVLPQGGIQNTAATLLRTPSRYSLAFQLDQMLPPKPIAPAPPGLASSTSSLSVFNTRSDRSLDTDGSVYRHSSQTTSRRASEMAEDSVSTGSAHTPPNSLQGSSVPQANSSRAFPCFPSATAPVSNPREINYDEAKGKGKGKGKAEDPLTIAETTAEAEMSPRTTETSSSIQSTELSPTTTATANADANMTEEVDTIPVEEVRRENFAESPNQRLDDERGNSSEPPAEHREEEMHGEEERLEIQGNEERENMEISVDEVAGPKDQQASISGFNHSYEEGSGDGQGSEERLDDEEMHGEEERLEIEGERENMEISEDEVAGPKDQQASVSGFNHSYEEGSWDGQGSEGRLDDEGENNSDPWAEHREETKEIQGDEVEIPEKDENRRDEVRMEIQGKRENTEISEDEDQRASVTAFNGAYGEGSGDGLGSEESDDDCQIVCEMPPPKTTPQKRKKREMTPPPARKMTTRSMKLGSSTSTGQLSEDRGNGGAGGVKKASKKRLR